ncbi:DUF4139 domain-containing protein [Zavarzinia aquatilis]|uniref:DUF4139 domain-containing protein n=1 Tax=Zavarzinia aquatilis TaxID=2211142 RepID=A0A317E8W4_9PROT|nr:DUF4139 domain-containing protein [Zavarzinia aquatilis]PWR22734.1 hypothetical protein DKG74_09860 [Zavarzinia aquatilis]
MRLNLRLKKTRSLMLAATAGYGVWVSTPALADGLELDRVMLSTGGVGYFEYEAKVSGNATLTLDVPLDQVDDVLKSLVVFDDKGGVGGVELAGREPIAQMFRDLPFGPEALESPVALLNALQGSEVVTGGSRMLRGRLLKVEAETRDLPGDQGTVTRNRITLLTGEGIQQLVLEDAESIKFADPVLQGQVDKALAGIAQAHARDRRSLTITATGSGSRTLRVAYVTGTPLWKTSYRLSLPADTASAKANLQGWAVLENTSGQDWKNVELTLVSGSPVTFRQALYASYYVDRPEVPVEVVGRILPNVDTGGSALAEMADAAPKDYELQDRSRAFAAGAVGAAPPMPVAAPAPMAAGAGPGLAEGTTEVASTEALTQVVFRLEKPVSVASGRSLSVPIVDRDVPAARLALYQPGVHDRHPLAAVRLTNDGETGLPPGILTLYEQGPTGFAYVGDARLAVLPAGEERMVSYALDQKLRVDHAETSDSTLTAGSIAGGVFRYETVERRTMTYRIAAPAREARSMILELPKLSGYTVVAPASGVEETDRYWRVPATLDAGKTVEVKVVAERKGASGLAIANLNDAQIAYYGASGAIDAKTKAAFAKLAELRRAISSRDAVIEGANDKLARLGEEQARLRENLASVPKDTDLYRRYLKKLDEQETAIEKLQASLAEAQDARETAVAKLDEFIAGL